MLENIQQYYYPETVEQILDLMQQPNAIIIAGGTGLALERNQRVTSLIDLQNSRLSFIEEKDDNFHIGAMTSVFDICHNTLLPESLRKAADCIGDTPLLHAVTIGGNLAKFYNWVDLPPMLWALNASIVVFTPEKKVFNADDFFSYANKHNIYSRRVLITKVIIPKPPQNHSAKYQSLAALENKKGDLNLATYFEWNDKYEISNAKIVLSALLNVPTRLTGIENVLKGKNIRDGDIKEIDLSAIEELVFKHNFRFSKGYLKHILYTYLRRALRECKQKMEVH